MTLRSRRLEVLLLCAAVFSQRLAHADPSATEISAAKQAFENAVALENARKWAEAALKLREALAVKDTPGLRFHLAHCEEQQGYLVEAALDYDRASLLLRQGAKAPDVQKLITAASAGLKPRIPHLVVEIPSDLNAPVARLDGKAYSTSELLAGQSLNPGRHQLTVSANGRTPFERSFSVSEAEQVTIRAELPQSPAPQPVPVTSPAVGARSQVKPGESALRPEPASTLAPANASHTKLFLVLGESAVAIAGVALAIGYGLAESSARDRIDSAQRRVDQSAEGSLGACRFPDPSLGGACSDLSEAIDDHDRAAMLSRVGFFGAGIAAAGLVTTLLVYPSSSQQATNGPLPVVVLGLGGMSLRGAF